MEYFLIILLLTVSGTLNAVCFFIGAKAGQKVSRNETVELPKIVSPMEIHRRHKAERLSQKEQNIFETIMENIDTYNGTSIGQKDIPKF